MSSLLLKLARRMKATRVIRRSPLVAVWLKRCYEIGLRCLYAKRGMPIAVGNDLFRVAVESRTMVSSYEGEQAVYDALTRLIGDGMTAFDIGANEGLFTLCAAKRIGSGGRVVCFEPAPEALRLLRHNIRLNGFQSRVDVVGKLVADRCGWERFYANGKSGYNSQSKEAAPSNADPIQVETVSIDAFVEATGRSPDVVKIDVEGAELQVLRGMEAVLTRGDIVVLCEIHPACFGFFHASERDIVGFMERIGFGIYDMRMHRLPTLQQHVIFAK